METDEVWKLTLKEFAKECKKDLNTIANEIWRTWIKNKLSGLAGQEMPYGITEFKQLYKKLKRGLLKDPSGARLVVVGRKEYVVATYEHKDIVAKAVKEGKQVPDEVLKDYPDLRGENQ